ncbi:hypothetical protein [Arthrobacter sp. 2MCAF14]|uniref:hypothetical protein n=1 Tax=Arthrobacter sp. 2MCAF14 TaxID=3232982 RepID=UPI003F8FB97F
MRRHDDHELLVLGNFTPHPQPVDMGDPSWADAQKTIGNYPHSRALDLGPWELTALLRARA